MPLGNLVFGTHVRKQESRLTPCSGVCVSLSLHGGMRSLATPTRALLLCCVAWLNFKKRLQKSVLLPHKRWFVVGPSLIVQWINNAKLFHSRKKERKLACIRNFANSKQRHDDVGMAREKLWAGKAMTLFHTLHYNTLYVIHTCVAEMFIFSAEYTPGHKRLLFVVNLV